MSNRKLIYDVGANDGADTAYYLRSGYRVLAVEADPVLAAGLRDRFATAIAEGLVSVLHAAVLEKDVAGVDFFLSAKPTESSLLRSLAERPGPAAGFISVPGRNLCSLFATYGLPWYCKLDIEGADARALAGLKECTVRPAYISCEASGLPIGEIAGNEQLLFAALDALVAAGYRQFMLIDQESLLPLSDQGFYDRMHWWSSRVMTKLERWLDKPGPRHSNRRFLARQGLPEADSDSGAFGDALEGAWADFEVTRRRMSRHFFHYYQYTKNKRFIFWVDIHAKY
ncbi:MAG TPA: FkbM family methyltransferase [Puia sp.]|nr:FkbM family methyltransferase [Puia sp.]